MVIMSWLRSLVQVLEELGPCEGELHSPTNSGGRRVLVSAAAKFVERDIKKSSVESSAFINERDVGGGGWRKAKN